MIDCDRSGYAILAEVGRSASGVALAGLLPSALPPRLMTQASRLRHMATVMADRIIRVSCDVKKRMDTDTKHRPSE